MNRRIRLVDVGKDYPARAGGEVTTALAEMSLDIFQGEFLCIVGPSGCGKSTVLNIVAGLAEPTRGQITLDGTTILAPGAERGVVFQDYALFPWKTVRENVEFGLRYRSKGRPSKAERDARVLHYLELVGLGNVWRKYPHELSGGMRQRCALARALANDPQVLLMDEPLAALDAQTRLVLQEELLRIWGEEKPAQERRTVIFITHGIDEAVFLADRIVVMTRHPGRIKNVLDVDLPRPRDAAVRGTSGFRELCDTIWQMIRDDAYAASVDA